MTQHLVQKIIAAHLTGRRDETRRRDRYAHRPDADTGCHRTMADLQFEAMGIPAGAHQALGQLC